MKKNTTPFVFTNGILLYPIIFVLAIWLVYWFEIRFQVLFNDFGIYPRTLQGVRGVFFGPFIHGGIKHLFNNSVPLFVLTAALFYFYRKHSWQILVFGLLATGLLTWVIGRPANHIGASGVIYMLVAFLFFKGVFSKHYRLLGLSLIVVFLYGGLLWYVVPIDPKISWEGHLSGFFVGFVFALLFPSPADPPKVYEWQQEDYNPDDDPFLQHFDANGNFIETPKEPENQDTTDSENRVVVTYRFKEKPNTKGKE